MLSAAQILSQLIAIPSINPLLESSADLSGEARLSDWLVDFFQSLGARHERIEVSPGRHNVLAGCEVPGAERTILLDAHQDTVPVEGMTIAPFIPHVHQGRMYGRGAADVKGGLAAMLHAFQRVLQDSHRASAHVVLSCTCDEEALALGIRDLVTYWHPQVSKSQLLKRAPQAAVVAEPTDLNVVVAHRGVLRFRIRTIGRACHSSHPQHGKNAIYAMARVVSYLEALAERFEQHPNPHRLCGGPALSVGRISGGVAVNIVPDQCVIEIDRRLIPGEDPQVVYQELQSGLTKAVHDDCLVEPAWLVAPALSDELNVDLAQELIAALDPSLQRGCVGVPYCTNASSLAAAGVPTVVFGPGSIAQAHTCDEYIDMDQLDMAAEAYFRLCTRSRD